LRWCCSPWPAAWFGSFLPYPKF
jgi:hypothetical protein